MNIHFLRKTGNSISYAEIVDSLTFKTLSLGFCITAVDQWQDSFGSIKTDYQANVELLSLGTLVKPERNIHELFTKIDECFKKDSDYNENHIWKEKNMFDFLTKN